MENIEQHRKAKLSFPISLPITINAASYTTFLPITITADSITTTGQWSPLFPTLDPSIGPTIMSLTLPTRLTFPTTITIATNTFTAAATITTTRTLFNIFVDNEPHRQPPPPHSHSGYHQHLTSTHSITALPVILTLILEHNNNNNNNNNSNNNNNNRPVAVHITITDNLITIDGHPLFEPDVADTNPSLAAILLMVNADIPDED
ncbi:hypothetical protein TanjilG_07052 [Lupinus angustifolius]|uniref:Uncharacterized protein n=1 Tax=Lupinus angustifolius TaxID=3871 RepID=A0A4P1QXS5_LUPAN|nr:hypothetical protein TanjilG_07052 [Lupinus angustifolius]